MAMAMMGGSERGLDNFSNVSDCVVVVVCFSSRGPPLPLGIFGRVNVCRVCVCVCVNAQWREVGRYSII